MIRSILATIIPFSRTSLGRNSRGKISAGDDKNKHLLLMDPAQTGGISVFSNLNLPC